MSRKLTFTILYFDQLKLRYFIVASITSAERTPVKQNRLGRQTDQTDL